MVALTYHIRPSGNEAFETDSRCLLVEACSGKLSVLLWDKARSKPEAAEVFTGITDYTEQWEEILQQSALMGYHNLETFLFFNFPRFLAIPAVFYQPSEAVTQLNAFFGEAPYLHTGGDIIPDLDMVLAWQVPKDTFECLADHFDVVHFKSVATMLLQTGPGLKSEAVSGKLLVSGKLVWLAVWRNTQLIIIKSLPSDDPENISYQMLNICRQWGIPNDKIHWNVAGMVNEDSPLWMAAGRFFEHFEPENSTGNFGADTPPHFFARQIQFLQKATEA